MQGVKPGEAEVGFSDVLDVQPPLGVPGVLTDEGLPGALSDELGVHGDVVLGKLGALMRWEGQKTVCPILLHY